MKKGISLIVLIITIIIILILTAAVVMSFTSNNPIDSANEAVVASNCEVITDKVNMWIATQMASELTSYALATEDQGTLVETETQEYSADSGITIMITSTSADSTVGQTYEPYITATFAELGLENYATVTFTNGVCTGYITVS